MGSFWKNAFVFSVVMVMIVAVMPIVYGLEENDPEDEDEVDPGVFDNGIDVGLSNAEFENEVMQRLYDLLDEPVPKKEKSAVVATPPSIKTTFVIGECKHFSPPGTDRVAELASTFVDKRLGNFKVKSINHKAGAFGTFITQAIGEENYLGYNQIRSVYGAENEDFRFVWYGNDPNANVLPLPHEIVYSSIYTFSCRQSGIPDEEDTSDCGKEYADTEIVVLIQRATQLSITQWPTQPVHIPQSVNCYSELEKYTRFASSIHGLSLLRFKDECNVGLSVSTTSVWNPTKCPDEGIEIITWTAQDAFHNTNTKHVLISVADREPPKINEAASRVLCVVDTKREVGPTNEKNMCMEIVADHYARTQLFKDNCSGPLELSIIFHGKKHDVCIGEACTPVIERLDDGSVPEYKQHAYYDGNPCSMVPLSSVIHYRMQVSDICGNKHSLVDLSLHYVSTESACPDGTFIIDGSMPEWGSCPQCSKK